MKSQKPHRQIDCLSEFGAALGNASERLWEMRNGYALCKKTGIQDIEAQLGTMTELERDRLEACYGSAPTGRQR
jgi:hypothetical protein